MNKTNPWLSNLLMFVKKDRYSSFPLPICLILGKVRNTSSDSFFCSFVMCIFTKYTGRVLHLVLVVSLLVNVNGARKGNNDILYHQLCDGWTTKTNFTHSNCSASEVR